MFKVKKQQTFQKVFQRVVNFWMMWLLDFLGFSMDECDFGIFLGKLGSQWIELFQILGITVLFH